MVSDTNCYCSVARSTYRAQYEARVDEALHFIANCDVEVFERSADGTPFKGRMDSLGQVAAFMLSVHPAFHIGQLSAWRRVSGMGSAMG